MTSSNTLASKFLGRPGRALLVAALLAALLPACSPHAPEGGAGDADDTPTSGHVAISVDETFAPILTSEVDTFQKIYPDAHVRASYQPEDSMFLALLNDRAKVIIASRQLNAEEEKELTKQQMYPKTVKIGIDGLAIVLGRSNPDSLLTVSQLRAIFSGKTAQWSEISGQKKLGPVNVVFDQNRSSTSRFIRDSLLRGEALTPRAFAANSNPKLLDYVATHPNAIGVVGVNWISDFDDPAVRQFRSRVRVAGITSRANPTKYDFIQPFQVFLAEKTAAQLAADHDLQNYPLRRYIYAISREARTALGSGFVSFVAGQKGQLIFQKSGLMPANVQARIVTTPKKQ